MVNIAPFHALRSSNGKSHDDISSFICPPYDVISPAQREAMVKKFKNNVIQVELPAGDGMEKYERAARILHEWKDSGFLQPDRRGSFYLLETTFHISDPFAPKSKLKRYGVLTALRLETPGKGAVHPHEKTLPKAKEDRLYLLRALKTNVSPIFGLFFDPKKEWQRWIKAATRVRPLAEGREHKDLSHRMWKIDDEGLQKKLRVLLKSKDLYIADGHHRYEVAWAYSQEQLTAQPSAEPDMGWMSVMAYVCPMEEPGLLMLPTHRLVHSDRTPEQWRACLEKFFEIRPVRNLEALVKILSNPKRRMHVIGWASAKGAFILTPRRDVAIQRCLTDRHQTLRELDVVLLHDLVLANEKEIVFTRDLKEIKDATKKDPRSVAFLLGSAGVEALARVASAGEVMPPKTTYFYPKVPTGFTLMPLEQRIS